MSRHSLVYRRWMVRLGARAFDRVSKPLASAWRKKRRGSSGAGARRWLLVNWNHLGDAVLTTGVVRALRRARPDDHIALLIGPWTAPLFDLAEGLDERIVLPASWRDRSAGRRAPKLSEWRRLKQELSDRTDDVLVDLAGDVFVYLLGAAAGFPECWGFSGYGAAGFLDRSVPVRIGHPQVAQWAELLSPAGVLEQDIRPKVVLSDGELNAARAALPIDDEDAPRVGLHVGGGRPEKLLPIDWLVLFVGVAQRAGWRVDLLGSEGERGRALAVAAHTTGCDLSGMGLDLRPLAARVSCLSALAGPDSGLAHLSAALDVPTLAVFHSSDEHARFSPAGMQVRTLLRPSAEEAMAAFQELLQAAATPERHEP
ncbi:MAG: glycosyltransferase family 9 protein [Planctomycetota bacterium]